MRSPEFLRSSPKFECPLVEMSLRSVRSSEDVLISIAARAFGSAGVGLAVCESDNLFLLVSGCGLLYQSLSTRFCLCGAG